MPVAENLINAPEFTVSELSSALKRTVEDAYGHVRVRGEISGFRGPHSSGHCYFALKDESAKIEAVIWKFAHARMRFKPQEGLEVIATGKLTTYPGSSKYQIVIEALEPAPRQALALAYYKGLSHSEIGATMGAPIGTVKAWMRRSLDRLKHCLEVAGVA